MNKPKKGTHELECYFCGRQFASVTHWGGNRKINCVWCRDLKEECIECFIENEKI